MRYPNQPCDPLSRRAFLGRSSQGLGAIALASLLGPTTAVFETQGRWKPTIPQTHHAPRVRRVIWLYMAGGMSHLETWDPKPKLAEMNGQPMPESFTKGQQIAQLQGQSKLVCLAPQHPFQRWGKSGLEFSTLFSELGNSAADDLCILRSMHTEAINHDPAHTFMNTGTMISGRPAAGSWVQYGLGSEAENLPGFVVLVSTGKYGQAQPIAARQWHSGFLPSMFQGVQFRSKGDAVLYVNPPPGITPDRQNDVVAATRGLDQIEAAATGDPEIATRIAQYEMAFRMQSSIPELVDFSGESKKTLEQYGTEGGDGSFASNCLLARRLAERGVRFVQLYHRDWDHHGAVKEHSEGTAREVDKAVAALIRDLKDRGLFDDTLLVFGTEFGRTPMAQGNGRDHHMAGFSMWLAGGGIRGGMAYGNTDELGYHAVENKVHVNDLHATMLHLLGIDHKRLTFRFQGRDFRLTDVAGEVLTPILA